MRAHFLILMLLGVPMTSAAYGDHLEPCWAELGDYRARFEFIVQSHIPEDALLTTNTFPSFSGESSVRVIEVDDSYAIAYIEFDESLWYAAIIEEDRVARWEFDEVTVNTKAYRSVISEDLVKQLISEWARSIHASRKSEVLGSDGVTYAFSLPDTGCARAWSPPADSRNRKLVEIVELLSDLAKLNLSSPHLPHERNIRDVLSALPPLQ